MKCLGFQGDRLRLVIGYKMGHNTIVVNEVVTHRNGLINMVTGVITPISGDRTLLATGRGPSCRVSCHLNLKQTGEFFLVDARTQVD